MIYQVMREAYPTITDQEWEELDAAAKRFAAAMPALTAEQIALVCELFPPITRQDIPPKAASHANTSHQGRHAPRCA